MTLSAVSSTGCWTGWINCPGISARLFWGNSKVLQGKEQWLRELLGLPREAVLERPLPVDVTFPPGTPAGILMIENLDSYFSACNGNWPDVPGYLRRPVAGRPCPILSQGEQGLRGSGNYRVGRDVHSCPNPRPNEIASSNDSRTFAGEYDENRPVQPLKQTCCGLGKFLVCTSALRTNCRSNGRLSGLRRR